MSSATAVPVRRDVGAAAVLAVLALGLLAWAKWLPYLDRVPAVAASRTLGASLLLGAGSAWEYALGYLAAVWPALVAGVLLAAGVEVLLPARWLRAALGREGLAGGLRGGLAALPSMMCTCCAAPVAVGLRRRGAALGPALAVWVGNPALNPVVLVFAAFVLPWELVALRAAFGVLLVAGLVALAARRPGPPVAVLQEEPTPGGYLRALRRLGTRLLPEYLLVLLAVAALQGLLPTGGSSDGVALGVAAVVLLAVVGTLLPVPTGAEVAAAAALLATGAGTGAAVALLLSLPALSLPSLLMVRSVVPREVLLAAPAVVAGTSAAAGLVALSLS